MKGQIRNLLPILLSFLTILILPIYTYTTFVTFKPEIPNNHEKEEREEASLDGIPFPQDATIIYQNKTTEEQTATIWTQKAPKEVQEFYESALASEGWTLESWEQKDGVFIYQYINRKESKRIAITSSLGQEATVTIISLSQL